MITFSVPTRKFLTIAKYDFYLAEIKKILPENELEMLTGSSLEDLKFNIKQHPDIEMIFFPHFSQLIPKEIFEKYTCIGFHTGNLPRDRGGSPIQHQILKGNYLSKISAVRITESIDGGAIYAQQDFDLSDGTIADILKELSKVIAKMIFNLIFNLPEPTQQKGVSTIYKRLMPSDSKIHLYGLTNQQIYDRIRMLDGLDYPKAFLEVDGVQLTLSDAFYDGEQVSFRATIGKKNGII